MTAYHYQCPRCFCTLYSDAAIEGENRRYYITDELCGDCQREIEDEEDYDEY